MRISDWSSDVCSSDLQRLAAFKASGRKQNLASMVEIMADTAYTDLRGFDVLPEILKIMKMGTLTDDQQAVVDLMQQRSEERRVGKECVSTCRSRWSPYN